MSYFENRSKLTGFLSRRNTASHRCYYRCKALPFHPSGPTGIRHSLLSMRYLKRLPDQAALRNVFKHPYVGITQIRLPVEGPTFLSARVTSSRMSFLFDVCYCTTFFLKFKYFFYCVKKNRPMSMLQRSVDR